MNPAMFLLNLTATLMLSFDPDSSRIDHAVAEQDGIRIEASVKAQLYTWAITNGSEQSITRFEIDQYNTYDHTVPIGWTSTYESGRFSAWATTSSYAIQSGQTREFSARGGSVASVLGLRTAHLTLADGTRERVIELPDVWAPSPKPTSMVLLVVSCLSVLAAAHFLVVRHRSRRYRPEAD